MSLARDELYLWGGVAVVGLLVLWKVGSVAKGIVTNDNALTRSATNASGEPVTAYKESSIPLIGTLGAAVNAALGGVPASIGEAIGGSAAQAQADDTASNAALIEAGYYYTPGLL